jgi:hypothetical protein
MLLKRTIIILILCAPFQEAISGIDCEGTIAHIYKWDDFQRISIKLDLDSGGFSPWISMPTRSDESMALMAFAAGKNIHVQWRDETGYTACTGAGAWKNNTPLSGWWRVSQN